MRGRLTYEWTQRPLLKILTHIKTKFVERIEQQIGKQYSADIERAMNDGIIDEKIKNLIENQDVDLLDENNNLVLAQQFSHLSQKNATAAGTGEEVMDDQVNIRLGSPDPNKLK